MTEGLEAPQSAATYRGRFAPSPTGPLHAGSLVAALASWLDARAWNGGGHHGRGGRWLVRIEDVDVPRCVPGAAELILQQLAACGLLPDEPPEWQSTRGALYQQALDQLIAQGHAYPCGCSRKDIEDAHAAQGHARERHAALPYPGTCRHGLQGRPARSWRFNATEFQSKQPLPLAGQAGAAHFSIANGLGGSRTWSVESENRRFHENGPPRGQFLPDLQPHSPAMGQKDGVLEERRSQKWTAAAHVQPTISKSDGLLVHWTDRRLGAQAQDVASAVGDFVLRRADGLWAYQLAVVVDDADQRISHVVRGEDLADNTPRQILLQRALGLPTPRYLHTPLVCGPNGEKLSKQNGAQALALDEPVLALSQAAAVLGLPPLQNPDTTTSVGDALAWWVAAWPRIYNPAP